MRAVWKSMLSFAVLLGYCRAQTGTDVKDLLKQLFTTNSYNKAVRPMTDQSQPLEIDVDFYLVSINEIDDIEQKMTTTAYIHIQWIDEFLTWTPASYGNLSQIYVSQNDIWKPDITLRNGFTKLSELGSQFIRVIVYNTGIIQWKPFEVFETKCEIDITYFPFDKQSCQIIFVVWTSSLQDVLVTLWNNAVYLDEMENNAEWTIVSTEAREELRTFDSRTIFTLNLQRNSGYYMMNIIIPVMLLSILNVFTFALPADSGEKIGYSVTVFLSFAVFLTIVSAELPRTSGSLLGYYLIIQLAMGTFVVCFTVLELRLHHRKDEVPTCLVRLMNCRLCRRVSSSRLCVKVSPSVDENKEYKPKENLKEKTWEDFTSFADFLLFWVTLVLDFVVTTVFLGILGSNA